MLYPADPDGTSYLHPGMLRTPTGSLYPYPPLVDPGKPLGRGDWTYSGLLKFGYLRVGGDRNAEYFREYDDWKSGAVLGLLALDFNNRKTGEYVDFRGSRVSGNDQFYRLRGGRYGHYRIEGFYRDMPHTVSTSAYPIWNGVGSTDLTLPSPLVAGATRRTSRGGIGRHATTQHRPHPHPRRTGLRRRAVSQLDRLGLDHQREAHGHPAVGRLDVLQLPVPRQRRRAGDGAPDRLPHHRHQPERAQRRQDLAFPGHLQRLVLPQPQGPPELRRARSPCGTWLARRRSPTSRTASSRWSRTTTTTTSAWTCRAS
ncbi:hypothetical protein RLIN73S_02439 [Rhodanobacter lindaniclasticus]